jgi:hypothetical protein
MRSLVSILFWGALSTARLEAQASADSIAVELTAARHLLAQHPARAVLLDSAYARSTHAPGVPATDHRPLRRHRTLADSLNAGISTQSNSRTAQLTLSEPEFAGDSALVTVTVSYDNGRRPRGAFYETVRVTLRRAAGSWRIERSAQLGIS